MSCLHYVCIFAGNLRELNESNRTYLVRKNMSRLANAVAISALYLIFLAWYDGWGMTALTSTEVDQYIANIREDSELTFFVKT